LFLGLRLNRGIALGDLRREFGGAEMIPFLAVVAEAVADGLLEDVAGRVRLTPRGRLVSNELFQRFLSPVIAKES
jgi:oxygen-independent coproporphyrinogen-3 oxidase